MSAVHSKSYSSIDAIPTINLFGTPIHNLSMNETIDYIDTTIQNGESLSHIVVNAGKMVAMQTDTQLKESVHSADLINADGQSVVWASQILRRPLKERVAGCDLMINLVKLAFERNYKIFFLGAKEEVVAKVVETYSTQYDRNIIAGYRNGYFKKEEERGIAQQIADSGAQLLFVAITSPKKENFLHENRDLLKNVNFTMGVGGSFDVVAGKVSRAPVWMQNVGLEWFHRFAKEPRRMWKRYLYGNSQFIWMTIKGIFGIEVKNA